MEPRNDETMDRSLPIDPNFNESQDEIPDHNIVVQVGTHTVNKNDSSQIYPEPINIEVPSTGHQGRAGNEEDFLLPTPSLSGQVNQNFQAFEHVHNTTDRSETALK